LYFFIIIASEDFSEAKYNNIIFNSLTQSKSESKQPNPEQEFVNEDMDREIRFTTLIFEREISSMEDGKLINYKTIAVLAI
jgi:hypothetical protein